MIPSGDPSKGLRRGRLLQDDAGSRGGRHGQQWGQWPHAYRRRKGKGKTPERSWRPAGGHPHDSDPFFTASDGDERGRRHRRGVAGGGGGDVPIEPEDRSSESTECETETPRWGDLDEEEDMDFGYTEKPPSSDPPRRPGGDPPGHPGGGPSGRLEDAHQVDPPEADLREGEDPPEDPLGTPTTHQGTVTRMPPGG